METSFLHSIRTGRQKTEVSALATLFVGDGLTAASAVMAVGAGNLIDVQANQVDVDLSEAAAAVMAEADEFIFLDNDDSSAAKRESFSDLLDTIAGTVSTTGLDRSGATLVVSDLHPVGVDGSANQLLTDDGDGTVTSEAHLTFDGSDLKLLEDVNDGNPSLSIGGADAEKLQIQSVDSGAQTLDYVKFSTAVASGTDDKGKYIFDVDGTDIITIKDGGLDVTGDLKVTNDVYQQRQDLTDDLSVGWHTIAVIAGKSGGSASGTAGNNQRGVGHFVIKEQTASRHATYDFYANHLFF